MQSEGWGNIAPEAPPYTNKFTPEPGDIPSILDTADCPQVKICVRTLRAPTSCLTGRLLEKRAPNGDGLQIGGEGIPEVVHPELVNEGESTIIDVYGIVDVLFPKSNKGH